VGNVSTGRDSNGPAPITTRSPFHEVWGTPVGRDGAEGFFGREGPNRSVSGVLRMNGSNVRAPTTTKPMSARDVCSHQGNPRGVRRRTGLDIHFVDIEGIDFVREMAAIRIYFCDRDRTAAHRQPRRKGSSEHLHRVRFRRRDPLSPLRPLTNAGPSSLVGLPRHLRLDTQS